MFFFSKTTKAPGLNNNNNNNNNNNSTSNNMLTVHYSKVDAQDHDLNLTSATTITNGGGGSVLLGQPKIISNGTRESSLNDLSNLNKLFASEELKSSAAQPLLGGKAAIYQSSIVAPNMNVMPNEIIFSNPTTATTSSNKLVNKVATTAVLPPQLNQQQPINVKMLISELNELKEVEEFDLKRSDDVDRDDVNIMLTAGGDDHDESLSSSLSLCLPSRIKSTDLHLIEKIASGQFSNVWRARCVQAAAGGCNEVEEYAVKVFFSNQKASWLNEREIYHLLSTTNEFILKYYGADVAERAAKASQAAPPGPGNFFNPIAVSSSNEYWIVTEYHPCGSLYDFLKLNVLSWSQIVHICYSILEGLAFLHGEHHEFGKKFAIAHRDLKSKNILVKKSGFTCCIADFGLALRLNNSNKLSSAEIRSKVGITIGLIIHRNHRKL
jgi:hypothetical protein